MGRNLNKERVGMVFTHPKYGEYEIVEYVNSKDVTVRFKNTGSLVNAHFKEVRLLKIRDRTIPSVYGVGIIGAAVCYVDGKAIKSYKIWADMLKRCYSDKWHEMKPTYKGCTVCDEWKYYSNFKVWFDCNYIKNHQLDKDIRVEGNRVYSPETCMFVTATENTLHCRRGRMYHTLVKSPTGEEMLVYNIAKFCRDNRLCRENFNKMILGGRRQAQGWKLLRRLSSEEAVGLNISKEVGL